MGIDVKYISVEDAIHRYGIGRTKLYELFDLSECPQLRKLGKKVLIPLAEFDNFFDSVLGYSKKSTKK